MKNLYPILYKLMHSMLVVGSWFCSFQTQAQCNVDYVEVCNSGGTFSNWTNMDIIATCLDNVNSNEGAYVVFNVVTGGELNVSVEGLPNGNNFMDVAVYTIPNGTAPCDAPVQISCNFAATNSDCASFGGGLGCASNVGGPMVNTGDRIMVLAHDYNNVYSSFSVAVGTGVGKAVLGPPLIDLQPTGPLQEDGAPVAVNTGANHAGGGVWSASCGACINGSTGFFDPTAAGAGTHTVTYTHYTLGNPCYNTASIDIMVNAAPTFTSPNTATFGENGTGVAIDVQSTDDADIEPIGLTYAIVSGNDGSLFTIDADDGELRFVTPPDFENPADGNMDNDYVVEVEVCDSQGGCSTQLITVSVTNVNEAPEVMVNAAVSYSENGTGAVDDVSTADDNDTEGSGLTYSLTGTDATLFNIDASGNITFIASPDFENPSDSDGDNVYDIIVNVEDSGGLTDSDPMTITVVNDNEAPEITSNGGGATASTSIDENQTAITMVTATDIDAGDTQSYSISGGADGSLFSISPTGELIFMNPPDFEMPIDVGMDNIYEVEVTVTDAGGLTDVQTIAITINDVDEDGDGFLGADDPDDNDVCVPNNADTNCCEAAHPEVTKD